MEIAEIKSTVQDTRSYNEIIKTLFQWRVFERYNNNLVFLKRQPHAFSCRVLLGMILQFLQQLTGMNVIM